MNLTQETLDLLKQAQTKPMLQKAGITTGTGLVTYALEAGAKLLYPVLTPLRNTIPRVSAEGNAGTALHWKQITSINALNMRAGVSEGKRGGVISYTEADKLAMFKGIGLEDSVSFEAQYAGMGFEDARALAVMTLLQAMMIEEEKTILNGNSSLQLGVTPTPTVTPVATGTIPAGTTNFVFCVAMSWWAFTGNGGAQNPVPSNATLTPVINRTNAGAGSSDTFGGGTAQISAASAAFATVNGTNQSVTAAVAPVKGAFGYAWFLGAAAGAANANLAAITSLPTVTLTGPAASTYPANSVGLNADNSTNALEFDGLITQTLASTGYYKSLNSATLTADGKGGVAEIDAMLKYFWDTYRLSPDKLFVDSQVIGDITKKVAGSSTPAFRINLENNKGSLGSLVAGTLVGSYLNKYALGGVKEISIVLHPNMPTGTIYAHLETNPYPNSRVPVPVRIRTRKEYYQIEWPLVQREYDYGVYADEALQVYIPFGHGVLADIGPG